MQAKKFTFLSSDGITTIHAVRWLPDSGKYSKILQITHGMIEHIWRYETFAEYLTEHDFMVVGMDLLGHGDSVLSEDKWGYFTEKKPSDIVCRDIHKLRKGIQRKNPGVPYFMMGHSMGSYMLRKYLARYTRGQAGTALAGAIIVGTGYVEPAMSRMGIGITKILARFKGWDCRSRFVDKLIKSGSYKEYDLTGADLSKSWLTKDEAIVASYDDDPKCSFHFTLNGYLGLFEAVYFTCQKKNVEKVPKTLPLYFIAGEEDPVGDMGEGVIKVVQMFQDTGHTDVSCKLYPNDRHEILNETDKEIVFDDIYAWLNSRG